MSIVFIGQSSSNDKTKNKAAAQDDASKIEWIDSSMVDNKTLAFDHKDIFLHYRKWKEAGGNILVNKEMNYLR